MKLTMTQAQQKALNLAARDGYLVSSSSDPRVLRNLVAAGLLVKVITVAPFSTCRWYLPSARSCMQRISRS